MPTVHWELLDFRLHTGNKGRWERLLYNNIMSQDRWNDIRVLMQSMPRLGALRYCSGNKYEKG